LKQREREKNKSRRKRRIRILCVYIYASKIVFSLLVWVLLFMLTTKQFLLSFMIDWLKIKGWTRHLRIW
jgi:cell division septal protein FtsQ